MFYALKPNSRIKSDPQQIGEICEALANNGGLTAKRLLEESRDESAPLHNEFEWDDSIAAENYRESQAAHIIRCLVVKPDSEGQQEIRAFINVTTEIREYKPLSAILKSPDLKEQMLKNAKHDMDVFIEKYKALCELTAVICAMKDAGKQLKAIS